MSMEAKRLEKSLIQICWYMRGSINIKEAYMLTARERELINSQIKDNIEATKKAQMPLI